jgi:rhodanese-related sulfurtransferase
VGSLAKTSLSLIDAATNRVVQTIALGTIPMHLTASPDRHYLYIGSVPTKQLLVYDVERGRVVKRIDLGGKVQPHQIAVVGKPTMGSSEAVQARGGYHNIDAKQLRAMMPEKSFLLINVHTPYAGELPRTDLFIPFNKIEQNLAQLPKDKSAKIVVYCRSGRMSAIAAKMLVKLGYTNVWNLKQGMRGWQQAGYPLLDKSRGSSK